MAKNGVAVDELPKVSAKKAEPVPLCIACRKYHGSVNEELRCLRAAVREDRSTITELLAELASRLRRT